MKSLARLPLVRWAALAAVATTATATAAAADAESPRTRISASGRAVWGVEAKFGPPPTASLLHAVGPGVVGVLPESPSDTGGPASEGGVDRTYANGHVRRDGSGNAGDLTGNWAYVSADQISGDYLTFDGTSALNLPGESGVEDEPAFGFELKLQRDFFRGPRGAIGMVGGFNWTDIEISSAATLTGTGSYVKDYYPLGGIIPPAAPFTGSFSGPNALIGDAPIRTVSTGTVTATGSRSLEGSLYGFKLGLYGEYQLCRAASLELAAGPTLVYADASFSYAESLAYNGRTTALSGQGSGDDWLLGAFVDLTLHWRFTDAFELFVGAGWQAADDLDLTAGPRSAEIGLGTTFNAFLGLGYSF